MIAAGAGHGNRPSRQLGGRLCQLSGPIRVLVLFDPLAPGANQHQATEHLRDCYQHGTMRWGTTYHIRPNSERVAPE